MKQKYIAYYCKCACNIRLTVVSAKADPDFSTTGFSNWKKVVSRFREHESSCAHRDSMAASLRL